MAHEHFRERLSTALKRQLNSNDPDITNRLLESVNSEYSKYVRGEKGSPNGDAARNLALAAKIDWEKLIDENIPISDVFQSETVWTQESPSHALFERSLVNISLSDEEIAKHILRSSTQAIGSLDLAVTDSLATRSCFGEIYQSILNGFKEEEPSILNIYGHKGSGKSTILSALQVRAIKDKKCTVIDHLNPNTANLESILQELKGFVTGNGQEKCVLFLDFDDLGLEEVIGSISGLKAWLGKFDTLFNGNVVLLYSSVTPNVPQYEGVATFGTTLTLEDELNLFNYLSRFLTDSRVVVPDIQEFWRRTGGRRNHGGNAQVFIDSYAWSCGERSEFLDHIRSLPHEFSLLKYIATSQLLDLPLPTKMLSKFSGPGIKSVVQLESELPELIQRMQIFDDSVHGVKLDSIVAGIEVMRALNCSSQRDLLSILKEISDCCQSYMVGAYDIEVARYYRLFLHRLAKGRGIGSADLNGGRVISEVVSSILDSVTDAVFFHTKNPDELCEWIGTLTMMGRHVHNRDLSQRLNKETIRNLSDIISAVDVADISPRAFTSLSASISRLKSGKISVDQKEELLEIVRSFLGELNFADIILKDYERNKNWNWRSRLGTSIHTYAMLLKAKADLVPRHLNLSTQEGTLARKQAISVIEEYQSFLPEGVSMEQTSASRLLRAQLLQEFDMDAARIAFRELLPIPERDVRDGPENSITVVRAFIDFHLEHGGLDEIEINDAVDGLADIAAQAIDFLSPGVIKNVSAFVIAWKFNENTTVRIDETLSTIIPLCYTTSSLERRLVIEGNLITVVQVLTDEARYPPISSHSEEGLSGSEESERAVLALKVALGVVKYCASEFTLSQRTRKTIGKLLWGMGRLETADLDYAAELAGIGELLAA